jgi:predicted nucleotidyltransferase
MLKSDEDDLDIYITNSSSIIEDELITYIKEKREDKKVSF